MEFLFLAFFYRLLSTIIEKFKARFLHFCPFLALMLTLNSINNFIAQSPLLRCNRSKISGDADVWQVNDYVL